MEIVLDNDGKVMCIENISTFFLGKVYRYESIKIVNDGSTSEYINRTVYDIYPLGLRMEKKEFDKYFIDIK